MKESQQYPAALGEAVVKAWLKAAVFSEHKPMTPASSKFKARYTSLDADLDVPEGDGGDGDDPWGATLSQSGGSTAASSGSASLAGDDPWAAIGPTSNDDSSDDPWRASLHKRRKVLG